MAIGGWLPDDLIESEDVGAAFDLVEDGQFGVEESVVDVESGGHGNVLDGGGRMEGVAVVGGPVDFAGIART